ncbi:MAG: PIN domain-containing protein [Oscillospiraceae bacterium]|nr:PIN domain-containing protein [Oscillospiraceae bacterium]
MKVYLDCCCYCRQFDDLTQERVKAEVDAIFIIFDLHWQRGMLLVGSSLLEIEIGKINDCEKKSKILKCYQSVDEIVRFSDSIDLRSLQIQEQSNIHAYDSIHIACAEEAGADVMLTTDDRLIKMASRLDLKVKVMNPRDFIDEYMNGGDF